MNSYTDFPNHKDDGGDKDSEIQFGSYQDQKRLAHNVDYGQPPCIVAFTTPSANTIQICEVFNPPRGGYYYHQCNFGKALKYSLKGCNGQCKVTVLGYFIRPGAPMYPGQTYSSITGTMNSPSDDWASWGGTNPTIFSHFGFVYTPTTWPSTPYLNWYNGLYKGLFKMPSGPWEAPEWHTLFYGLNDFPVVDYNGATASTPAETSVNGLKYTFNNCQSQHETTFGISSSMMTQSTKESYINHATSTQNAFSASLEISATTGFAGSEVSSTASFGYSHSTETTRSNGRSTSLTRTKEEGSTATVTVPANTQVVVQELLTKYTNVLQHSVLINGEASNVNEDQTEILPAGFKVTKINC
jgi:hypothetical protein